VRSVSIQGDSQRLQSQTSYDMNTQYSIPKQSRMAVTPIEVTVVDLVPVKILTYFRQKRNGISVHFSESEAFIDPRKLGASRPVSIIQP